MGKWKAIRGGAPRRKKGAKGKQPKPARPTLRLYDLSEDIGEANDLAARHPDVAAKMAKILDEAYTDPRAQREPQRAGGKRHR